MLQVGIVAEGRGDRNPEETKRKPMEKGSGFENNKGDMQAGSSNGGGNWNGARVSEGAAECGVNNGGVSEDGLSKKAGNSNGDGVSGGAATTVECGVNNGGVSKDGFSKKSGSSNGGGARVSEGAVSTMAKCGVNNGGVSIKAGGEPFSLDEEKLAEKYSETPDHLHSIKAFPRRTFEMFYRLKERIPIAKNKKFLQSLYNTKNAEETVGAFQVTKQSYEEKFGEPYEDVKVKPTVGATGGRGKDTVAGGNIYRRSEAWLKGVNWGFNVFTDFVEANPEFGLFNWSAATLEEIDLFLGYLWVWLGPQEGGSSLGGTRYTSETLKQMKTKFHNLICEVLKRPDVDLNSPAMSFSNNQYIAKRNRTAAEPMEGNAGDRKREALGVADIEKMDTWMADLNKVSVVCH